MSTLACQGCSTPIAGDSPTAHCCPHVGRDDGDHVVGRTLDPARVRFPTEGAANPFERYRTLTHAYALAISRGMTDAGFVTLVRDLDRAVADIAGHGFATTPFERSSALSNALRCDARGGVWVKDETHNVSGSHKARHVMGLAILGEVQERLGIVSSRGRRLAIASCGNAALAAAIVARAWQRPLDVFIPPDANPRVVDELRRHGATTHVCARAPGIAGDPCYHAFHRVVADGSLPFCCQGPDNGLNIEGGATLGWEIIDRLISSGQTLDRLFVQVGGGALASACIAAFHDAARLGVAVRLPRIHPVQTAGAAPLRRAWERVCDRLAPRLGLDRRLPDAALATSIRERASSPEVRAVLDDAARHRSEFMWPWETPPQSVAHGILDDETYDWLAIVRGMIESGGHPIVVSEERLREANALGRECTGIDADETGTAGLAGALELGRHGEITPHETIAVLFTGVRRSPTT